LVEKEGDSTGKGGKKKCRKVQKVCSNPGKQLGREKGGRGWVKESVKSNHQKRSVLHRDRKKDMY